MKKKKPTDMQSSHNVRLHLLQIYLNGFSALAPPLFKLWPTFFFLSFHLLSLFSNQHFIGPSLLNALQPVNVFPRAAFIHNQVQLTFGRSSSLSVGQGG